MEHENDPDIDEPYVPPAGNVVGPVTDQQSVDQPSIDQPSMDQTASDSSECMGWHGLL